MICNQSVYPRFYFKNKTWVEALHVFHWALAISLTNMNCFHHNWWKYQVHTVTILWVMLLLSLQKTSASELNKKREKKKPWWKGKFHLRETFQTISDNVTFFSLQLNETKIANRTDAINRFFIHLINKSDYVTKPRYPETSPSESSQTHHFLNLFQ